MLLLGKIESFCVNQTGNFRIFSKLTQVNLIFWTPCIYFKISSFSQENVVIDFLKIKISNTYDS